MFCLAGAAAGCFAIAAQKPHHEAAIRHENGHRSVDAATLRPGGVYKYSGDTKVIGNIPQRVRMTITDGTLTVHGNVGNDVALKVDAPKVLHEHYVKSTCTAAYNAYAITMKPCTRIETAIVGLQHDDKPTIRIIGQVGGFVQLETDGRSEIGDRTIPAKYPVYRQHRERAL